MSRALVLGGGGPVGIAWETGLLLGFAAGGVQLAAADTIIGTSAGSAVGAQLALGMDLSATTGRIAGALSRTPAADAGQLSVGSRFEALMAAVAAAMMWEGPDDEARRPLGRLALESDTIAEDDFVGLFDDLAGEPWPGTFSCTAVDAETGAFVVWDHDAGVDLQRAVASSCAVPAIYPAVTIGGRRYIDGGMRTSLNADLAAGSDVVVAVSVTALALPPGMEEPFLERLLVRQLNEFDALRAGGAALAIVEPDEDFLAISDWGLSLMDFSRTDAAMLSGLRLGEKEADRVRQLWER